jgi:hypothetical protein
MNRVPDPKPPVQKCGRGGGMGPNIEAGFAKMVHSALKEGGSVLHVSV